MSFLRWLASPTFAHLAWAAVGGFAAGTATTLRLTRRTGGRAR